MSILKVRDLNISIGIKIEAGLYVIGGAAIGPQSESL